MLLFFLNVSKTVELCRKNAKPMLGPLMEAVEIFDNFRYIYVRFGDQTLWRARPNLQKVEFVGLSREIIENLTLGGKFGNIPFFI